MRFQVHTNLVHTLRRKCIGDSIFIFCFLVAHDLLPRVQTTGATLLESLHYLDIQGPQHTRVRLNDSTSLRCRVTFVVVNRTQQSGLNTTAEHTPTWYGIAPGSVQPRIPLVIQWVKDGFGYDQDSLWHTFNGRYRIAESKDEGKRGWILNTIIL
ncbi:unnamed protein product [Echinostoma caproni]|uniref:DUF4912 domain-containing protein n=1 Tax=Echinostoma caproni TaxID=27848 RepID=A0A183A6E2_9TREM|nr:unnamed protein product [Echinostoma caproni]